MVLERSSERYVVLPEGASSATPPRGGLHPVRNPLIGNIFIGAGDHEWRHHRDDANASAETSEGVLTASSVAPPPGRRHVAQVAAHKLQNADSSAHLGRYAIAMADSPAVKFVTHGTLEQRVRHERRLLGAGETRSDSLSNRVCAWQWPCRASTSATRADIPGTTAPAHAVTVDNQVESSGERVRLADARFEGARNSHQHAVGPTVTIPGQDNQYKVGQPPLTAASHGAPDLHRMQSACRSNTPFRDKSRNLISGTTVQVQAFAEMSADIGKAGCAVRGENVRWDTTINLSSDADGRTKSPRTQESEAEQPEGSLPFGMPMPTISQPS